MRYVPVPMFSHNRQDWDRGWQWTGCSIQEGGPGKGQVAVYSSEREHVRNRICFKENMSVFIWGTVLEKDCLCWDVPWGRGHSNQPFHGAHKPELVFHLTYYSPFDVAEFKFKTRKLLFLYFLVLFMRTILFSNAKNKKSVCISVYEEEGFLSCETEWGG